MTSLWYNVRVRRLDMTEQEAVQDMVTGVVNDPTAPLTRTGLNIDKRVLERATPAKMYEDGGMKLLATTEICNRSFEVEFPTNKKTVMRYYNEFIETCYQCKLPPTFSLFAMYCGTTVNGYNKYMKQNAGSELGDALAQCKESIRSFIELSAMDGSMDKLIYFHQQKGYFDVVEKVELKHEVEYVDEEMSAAQIDAVISNLPPIDVTPIESD